MEQKELEALKKLKDGLLQVNGALMKLGKHKEDVIICLPNSEFAYFMNILSSGVSSISNFYIKVSEDEFKLADIRIKKFKGK